MYKLFYYPRNASWAPHMVLNALGAEYELHLVDRKQNAQKSSEYLKLNPTGRIPTLVDGELVLFESAAICLHLCAKHPGAELIPVKSEALRAACYQWLFYLNATLQPELMMYFYPSRHTDSVDGGKAIKHTQESRVGDIFSLIDTELKSKQFLLGDKVSVCDYFLFMLAHWASGFKMPPIKYEQLGRFMREFSKRSEVVSVCEVESTDLLLYR